ncbi:hypothetical protein, partial [Brevundimonas sp. 2YAF1]|uniref:hypothetical protein n=1 Tax=Brevundimonas sp. 2YAF1 TaxID=3233024 RepID=UPI003F9265D8
GGGVGLLSGDSCSFGFSYFRHSRLVESGAGPYIRASLCNERPAGFGNGPGGVLRLGKLRFSDLRRG